MKSEESQSAGWTSVMFVAIVFLALAFVVVYAGKTTSGSSTKANFVSLDCYMDREHEPWELWPDGQVLMVGHKRYLAVSREQRNSNDRYNGIKTYGFEIEIPIADKAWKKTECPRSWLK